jgi:hypothetical protein
VPARVADLHFLDADQVLVEWLKAPEATAGEGRDLAVRLCFGQFDRRFTMEVPSG